MDLRQLGLVLFCFAIAVAGGALIASARTDDVEPMTMERLQALIVQRNLDIADQIRPDSTFHFVSTEWDPSRADLPPGPGAYPVHSRTEYWVYYNERGEVAGYRSEIRDEDTGELFSLGLMEQGVLRQVSIRYPDSEAAESTIPKGDATMAFREALKERLAGGESPYDEGWRLVGADEIDRKNVFVLERDRAGGLERVYVDARTFRPERTEDIRDGSIVNVQKGPFVEILSGNQVPRD